MVHSYPISWYLPSNASFEEILSLEYTFYDKIFNKILDTNLQKYLNAYLFNFDWKKNILVEKF